MWIKLIRINRDKTVPILKMKMHFTLNTPRKSLGFLKIINYKIN